MNLQNGVKLEQNWFELDCKGYCKGNISDWRNGGRK